MKIAIKPFGGNPCWGDETNPIIRRRRSVQAYYGSARSDGSRLPFLLEPPAAAKMLASMVSSRDCVAAQGKAEWNWHLCRKFDTFIHHMKRIDFANSNRC
jgi:hypothetical protein